ncbi:MAG: hypothetical protein WAU89_18005 [Candidatus Acidiferrales bacterium]
MKKKQRLAINHTPDSEKISLWLPNADLAKLRALKVSQGMPINEAIRRAVAEWLSTK